MFKRINKDHICKFDNEGLLLTYIDKIVTMCLHVSVIRLKMESYHDVPFTTNAEVCLTC